MSEKYVTLRVGDTLVVEVVEEDVIAPPEAGTPGAEDLEVLLTIPPVTIFATAAGDYVHFVSDLDICNDGTGPAHGDPHHQSQTAYWNGGKCLNADKDKYIVVPPQVRKMVPPTVMGCQGRVTNMKTGVVEEGVVGDIGPDDKTGETAYCLAKILNPSIDYNVGDKERNYLYEIWPGIPAVVDGKRYALEPAQEG